MSNVVVAVLELLLMSELPRFRLFPPEENTSSTLSRLERVRERPEPGESGFVAGKLSIPYEEADEGRRQLGHQVKMEERNERTDARYGRSDPAVFDDVGVAARGICRADFEAAS